MSRPSGRKTALAALLVIACSEATTAPQPGSLRVSVETVGGDFDQDGYSLAVDSERALYVSPSSSRLFDNLIAGTHVVTLSGIADNCTLEGPPSRSVSIAPGETAEAVFAITCYATGIEITTQTTSPEPPFAYVVKIAEPLPKIGERIGSVAASGSFLVSRLGPGSHTVTLIVGDNCSVAGGNVATVNVAYRAVTRLTFEITCVRIVRRLAFVQDSVVGNFHYGAFIVVAGTNGAGAISLAKGRNPAWSPDGTRLVYSNAECDYYYSLPCTGGLLIMDVETGIASVPTSGRLGVDPAWSPDGKLIAFSPISSDGQAFKGVLYLAGLDNSPAVALPTPGVFTSHPSWSPDGQRIVFHCFSAQTGSGICVINRDGTGFTHLPGSAGWNGSPEWSPDGSKIAFATGRFTGGAAVALMNPDGTGVTRVATGWDPAWSPDGSKLIFAQETGLFTIGSDGSNLTRITLGRHYAPAWRP